MKIILPGWEGTKHILSANSYFLNKYMPGFDVHFINFGDFDGELYCGKFVSLAKKQIGGKNAWKKYVVNYLEKLDDKLVILADGDFLVTQPYNEEEYKKLLEDMKTHKVGYMSCGYDRKRFSRAAAYAIWDREFLLKILNSKKPYGGISSIWKFESRGSYYIKDIDKKKKVVAWRQVVRYDRSSSTAYRRNPGKVAVGEAIEEDIDYLVSKGHLPPKEELILDHPRAGHSMFKYTDIVPRTTELILCKDQRRVGAYGSGIRRSNKRYRFAVRCLKGLDSVIDLGCGMGLGTKILREAGYKVLGVDKYKDIVDNAKKKYKGNYAVMDIEDKDKTHYFINPANYDAAVCLEVLFHLKDPKKFLSSLETKHLVVSAPIKPTSDDDYIWRRFTITEKEFKNMFKDWDIIKEFKQTHYLTLYCVKREAKS